MLKNFLEGLLSLVLPKDADAAKIENMTEAELAEAIPRSQELESSAYFALFRYRNAIAQKAVWEIKYRGNPKLAKTFSKLLYEYIIEEIADAAAFAGFTDPLLVPIPASKSTLKERGFNQCELIAKEMGKIDGGNNFEIDFHALLKIKDNPHQSKLKNRAERLKNLAGSFGANAEKVKGRNIIVIDDVITTGATMREAMKTLRAAGAKKVLGFAIAH